MKQTGIQHLWSLMKTAKLGAYLIGFVLLGVSLWVYLELKRRGVLEAKPASTNRHSEVHLR